MVLCAHLFAVTTTLRLTPFVLKLPVRPPVLVAKQASSLAFLSDNRLGLGVGISPWPEDFANLQVDWARRGKRMDECMDILRGLTSGEFFGYDGRVLRDRRAQAVPGADRADPAARRRPRRQRAAPRRAQGRRLDARRRRRRGARPAARPARRDPQGGGRHPRRLRGARHLVRRLRPRRHQAPRGQGRDRLHRRLPGALHQGPGHRAARDQDQAPRAVRREHHPQGQRRERVARPHQAAPGRDRRGRGADRERAVHPDRAGPARGLRLPVRPDPDGHADGLRLRPRPAAVREPDAPVLPPGPRQPGRHLLQRVPARGRRVRHPRPPRHQRRPVVPGDGRHVLRRLGGHLDDGLRRPRAREGRRRQLRVHATWPSPAPSR